MNIVGIPGSKTCSQCKIDQPLGSFPKRTLSKDGLDIYCRSCISKQARARRERYKANYSPPDLAEKQCWLCKEVKSASEFYVDRSRVGGLNPSCKKCMSGYAKKHHDRRRSSYSGPIVSEKRCAGCKLTKPADQFAVARELKSGLSTSCKECDAKRHRGLRISVLARYSGGIPHCICCGETTLEFLSVDHINGGGRDHRKLGLKGSCIYRWLKKQGYPEGYQALCHNCNQAKGFYGKCPHQVAREAREARANRA